MLELDLSGIRFEVACDQPDQGGFARAVSPDKADPLPRVDLKVDVRQEGVAAESEVKVVDV